MADGTPDFADLLAAFDDTPIVQLHQISSSFPPPGGSQLPNNQPYISGLSHGQFHHVSQNGTPQSQLGRFAALNQGSGHQNQSYVRHGSSASTGSGPAVPDDGGGSLGSLFLSSVESMLSDEGGGPFTIQVPQPAAQAKTVQRKPRPTRAKQSNNQQPNRNYNSQTNVNAPNTNAQLYTNLAPAASPARMAIDLQNTALNSNVLGMKSTNEVSSPPFVMRPEMQPGAPNMTLGGQQKVYQQSQFMHPIQGSRPTAQPVNPPRPLSAASSSSEHLSRPGSVPQPSPSCGSNHSGDPATPLTPQSYNAGTPQSYKPATPQSNLSNQSQTYNAGTPQAYKPATPQSNLSNQRQRGQGYSDSHSQQMPSGMNIGGSESFASDQCTNMNFQAQPSPMQSRNTSNDSVNDLPNPLKEAFIAPNSSESFNPQNVAVNNQPWNTGPAVMAPNALFTSMAQSKMTAQTNFLPSDAQLNFDYTDVSMYGEQTQSGLLPQRMETNIGTESLTLKQNELLDQLSSFGKCKGKTIIQQPHLGTLDSGLSGSIESADNTLGKHADINTDTTMDMMNKASDAGAAVVKELLGSHTAQYEAISPVSDYAMSPSNKPSLPDELTENIIFSPPKFSSQPELTLGQDLTSPQEDPMNDPVLMYLKHDNNRVNPKNSTTTANSSGSFLNQGVPPSLSFKSEGGWLSQPSNHGSKSASVSHPRYPPSAITTKPTQLMETPNHPGGLWNPSLLLTSDNTTMHHSHTVPVTSATRATIETGPKIIDGSQMPSHKQKSHSAALVKTPENKPFGVNRRKSSSEKSKVSSSKSNKSLSYDADFGFESDDEAEPTIRLSKPAPKPKKTTHLITSKARIANTSTGHDLKDRMEQIQKLQQQQEMLLKIQRYQDQHKGNSQANVAMLHNAISQPPPPKPTTQPPAPPSEIYLKHQEKETTPFNVAVPTKFSTLPSHQVPRPTQSLTAAEQPPQDLPAPLRLVQPNTSPRFSDARKNRSHDTSRSSPNPLDSMHLTPTPTATSHLLGFSNMLADNTRGAQSHAPIAPTSALFTMEHRTSASTAPPTTSVTTATDIPHPLFHPQNTKSAPITPTSALFTMERRTSASIAPPTTSAKTPTDIHHPPFHPELTRSAPIHTSINPTSELYTMQHRSSVGTVQSTASVTKATDIHHHPFHPQNTRSVPITPTSGLFTMHHRMSATTAPPTTPVVTATHTHHPPFHPQNTRSAPSHAPIIPTPALFTMHHRLSASTAPPTMSSMTTAHIHHPLFHPQNTFTTSVIAPPPTSFLQTALTSNLPPTLHHSATSHRPPFTSSISSPPMPTPIDTTPTTTPASVVSSISSSRPQPFDSTHFDLEWLHREPDSVSVVEKRKTPEATSLTMVTPTCIPLQQQSGSATTFRAEDLPNKFTMAASKSVPPTLPEENVLPLKQSIHTVHHLNIPKSQSAPPVTSLAITKDVAPVSHETKHLNFKKHRILEGAYPQSTYSSHPVTQSNGVTSTMAHSVLDKQRRYSKDRRSIKPSHRVLHQVTEVPKSQASVSQPKDVAGVTPESSSDLSDKREGADKPELKLDESETDKSEVKAKDGKTGSMLLLFNSLLQEASESAADSLKTTLGAKQEIKPTDSEAPVIPDPSIVTKPPESEKPKVVVNSQEKTPTVPMAPVKQTAIQNVPPTKKPPKKHRPAATVPFKRRPYPAIDDLQATSSPAKTVSLSPSLPQPTPVTTSVLPSPVILPLVGSIYTTTSTTSPTIPVTIKILPVATKPAPVSIADTLTVAQDVRKDISTEKAVEKSPSKSAGLPKLRITTFRSSKGDIIHQSSMVGTKMFESVEVSDHSNPRKHRKRKKRKKKRKISSSDSDPPVSVSVPAKSSSEATEKLSEMGSKINKPMSKALEKKVEAILMNVDPSTSQFAVPNVDPLTSKVPKTSQKRKRTKAAVDNAEKKKPAKRVRVSKTSAKRKQDVKSDEPIARYQPKSALQACSSTPGASCTTIKTSVSLPSTFHRGPGKLPLYLNSSEAKSATVPTIQLVARNTKLLESVVESQTTSTLQQPAKVVNLKITNSVPSKSFPTQLLPSSGVHYIIPSTRGQQRIILPNISMPVTAPVSIVSPVVARSFSSAFLPVSICPLSTPTLPSTTKPQFFSMPISVSDTFPTSVKLISPKQVESTKSHSDGTSVTSASLSVFSGSKSSNLLGTQSSPSVTVTGALTVPRVTTKVSSSAVLSPMSANTFQSTFSRLISSQNPITRYSPPLPPDHLKMDLSKHKQCQCLECKDSFMFSESLEDHYERRSILIKVRCMQCNQNLVFLNKCKLLLHARQHSDKGGNGMQFNNAHISPLPLTMCKPRSKECFLNKSANVTSERRKPSVVSSEDENFNVSVNTPTSYPTVLSCTDCNFVATSPEALEEHFQRLAAPTSPDIASTPKPASGYTCDMCSVTVPNQCSFMAHMRMHKRATPHTCPECGQTFDNDGLKEHASSDSRREIDFNLHLSIQCFHLSRMSCYKCRLCSSIFKNADLLRRHLEVRHLQTFYKCRDCPMAFKTQDNIASHQRSAHGIVACTKVIHKCPLCDTVFTDSSPTQQLFLLRKHFEGHMNHPSINITAYKCLFCNNIYERKSLLRDHLKSAHDVTATGDSGGSSDLSCDISEARLLMSIDKGNNAVPKTAKKRPSGKPSAKEPSSSKVPKVLSPNENSTDVTNNLLIASGILGSMDSKRSLLTGKFASTPPAAIKSTKQPLKLRLKGMTAHTSSTVSPSGLPGDDIGLNANVGSIMRDGRKLYPCGECGKELPSVSARLNHIRLKHKGIRTLYCCPHCPADKIKFAKKISLKRHLKKFHDIEDMKKQDVRMEYARVPVGQRFEPASLNSRNPLESQPPPSQGAKIGNDENKVRKKVTALGRKPNRPLRQARKNLENGSPYVENSDSEVEQIMSNNNLEDEEKSDAGDCDFSILTLPDVYSCAKCGYQSKDRLEFQAHIIEHREDGECESILNSMQQCTECGLYFASLASRAKHLFIKHKIKKRKLLEKYDRRLKAERAAEGSLPKTLGGDGSNGQNLSGEAPRKHKCSVCYRRFEGDKQLRTHMRTHGLAFVKSKHISC